ncbi:MAG: hypothetical protein EXR99_15415 [Gemmataceae bacterium]|nr:hypothetical protein [Gemmataceae bacterium]
MTLRLLPLLLTALCGVFLGCSTAEETTAGGQEPRKKEAAKKVPVSANILLEIDGDTRRVWVSAELVRNEGPLELFLCRTKTKEHETLLAADIDARDLHKALMLAKGEPGSPVQFLPEYKPARGSVIKIFVHYEKAGKQVKESAQSWVRDSQTGKALTHDWVFAGSKLVPNPFDKEKPPLYLANDGDVICVSNFETALLDLPIASSKENAELQFEGFKERLPAVGTKVAISFEPVIKR